MNWREKQRQQIKHDRDARKLSGYLCSSKGCTTQLTNGEFCISDKCFKCRQKSNKVDRKKFPCIICGKLLTNRVNECCNTCRDKTKQK